jgi:hypothetical protein
MLAWLARREASELDEMPHRCSREDSSRPGFQDGFAFGPPPNCREFAWLFAAIPGPGICLLTNNRFSDIITLP